MVAHLVEITAEIIETYTDSDGTAIDIIEMRYPNGLSERRVGWVDENLDGIPSFNIRVSNGKTVKSTCESGKTNKWIIVYESLWMQRLNASIAENEMLEKSRKEQEDIELIRAAELAKADLGFDW